MVASYKLPSLAKAQPACPECGRVHRRANQSEAAKQCLGDEAKRLGIAVRGMSALLQAGRSPTLEHILKVCADVEHLSEAIRAHLRSEGAIE